MMPESDLQEIVDAVDWTPLRGASRILLTGGTGFVGTWLLESFIKANQDLNLGSNITVLTRRLQNKWIDSVHYINGDVVGDLSHLAGEGFTHVIHAACTASPLVDPLVQFDTIVQGTRNVLKASRSARVLYISSGAAKHRLNTVHGAAKYAAETLCGIYAEKGLHVSIARIYSLVGPGLPLDTHFALGNFIRDAITGGPIVVQGDGTPFRSYLYASDMAVKLWEVLLRAPAGVVVEIGSDDAINIMDLAAVVGQTLGAKYPILERGYEEPEKYLPSTGITPTVHLEEAILRTARFYGWGT